MACAGVVCSGYYKPGNSGSRRDLFDQRYGNARHPRHFTGELGAALVDGLLQTECAGLAPCLMSSAIFAKFAFAILPLGVMGMAETSRICDGRLYGARCFAAYSARSVSVRSEPGDIWTKARISSSPSVVLPTTADCTTAGWAFSTASTSAG